jgi:alpha-tubulin suppressor-like RCC1 family protein
MLLCRWLLCCSRSLVYQWGDIGIGRRFSDRHKKNKLTPSRVVFKSAGGRAAPKRIVSVFAGGHSTFALDEIGTAWFWGPNNYSQVGKHMQWT